MGTREETDSLCVVDALSRIIANELNALSSEFWLPRFAADQMDAELSFRRLRISELRAMRTKFEDVMHGLSRAGE